MRRRRRIRRCLIAINGLARCPAAAPAMSGLVDRVRTCLLGTVVGVRTGERVAALTFDDGPDPESTPALLDLLARHRAKGTFFLVGKRAAKHPALVDRLLAEGHAIGNHSWDHPALPTLPGWQLLHHCVRKLVLKLRVLVGKAVGLRAARFAQRSRLLDVHSP